MQTKTERASIVDVFCDDLLNWEARIIAMSERTNDDTELGSYTDIDAVLRSLRSHAEVLVDYLRDKPSNVREVISKTSGRAQ